MKTVFPTRPIMFLYKDLYITFIIKQKILLIREKKKIKGKYSVVKSHMLILFNISVINSNLVSMTSKLVIVTII